VFTIYLCHSYGPTEIAVCSSLVDLSAAPTDELALLRAGATRPSIGRSFTGVQCYVLDKQLRLCPIGVTGGLGASIPAFPLMLILFHRRAGHWWCWRQPWLH